MKGEKMGISIKDLDLVNFTDREEKSRELAGRENITLIAPYINLEKLESTLDYKVNGRSYTVIFAKDKEKSKYYLCELGIIETHEEYLVTLCEYLKPTMYFEENNDKYHFEDVYVASDMKCFLLSKDDFYINFLKERLSLLYFNIRAIYDLSDTDILDVLLFNDKKVFANIYFSHIFITKCLTDIIKKQINYDILLNCNKYYKNLPCKVGEITPNVVLLYYLYEDTIAESEYYSKEYIKDENLILVKLLKNTPGSIFENTPIWEVIKDNKSLARGTKIYIKPENSHIKIHLESYEEWRSYNIIVNAIFTTNIKVIICQTKVLKNGFRSYLAEEEIKTRHFQLFEIFKKLLNEKLESHDMLCAWKKN